MKKKFTNTQKIMTYTFIVFLFMIAYVIGNFLIFGFTDSKPCGESEVVWWNWRTTINLIYFFLSQ